MSNEWNKMRGMPMSGIEVGMKLKSTVPSQIRGVIVTEITDKGFRYSCEPYYLRAGATSGEVTGGECYGLEGYSMYELEAAKSKAGEGDAEAEQFITKEIAFTDERTGERHTFGGVSELIMAFLKGKALTHHEAEPDIKESVAEQLSEKSGYWHSCSGCHESGEYGGNEHNYPYSDIFKCHLGSGCQECGGIGARWDNSDYSSFTGFMPDGENESQKRGDDDEPPASLRTEEIPDYEMRGTICGGKIKRLSFGFHPQGVCEKCGGKKMGVAGQLSDICGNLYPPTQGEG